MLSCSLVNGNKRKRVEQELQKLNRKKIGIREIMNSERTNGSKKKLVRRRRWEKYNIGL